MAVSGDSRPPADDYQRPAPATPGRPLRGGGRFPLGALALDRSVFREPALLLALPVMYIAYQVAVENIADDRYRIGRAIGAHNALVFIAALVAACAAWEMTTLRRLWGRMVVRRPWWVVLAGRLAVPTGTGLVLIAAIYVLIMAGLPAPAWPGWTFPLLSVAGVCAWALVGAAFGLLLPSIAALPVALALPYLFMGFPVGWSDPIWLRHATGYMSGCCDTGSVPDPRATRATLAVFVTLAVVSLCVAAVRLAPARRGPTRPLAATVVAGATILGALTLASGVRSLGHDAIRDRPTSDARCADNVCLWPEDSDARAANVAAWARVRQAWLDLGLPAPPAGIGPSHSHTPLPIAVRWTSPATAQVALAQALPIAMRSCTRTTTFDGVRGTDNDLFRFGNLSYLIMVKLGVPGQQIGAVGVHVTLPPPAPQDAPTIWAATSPCPDGR